MTLLQRANIEMERDNFYNWYCSLSDEDRQELNEHFIDGMSKAIKIFSDILSQLPDAITTICNEFNISVAKLSEAYKEIEMNRVVK